MYFILNLIFISINLQIYTDIKCVKEKKQFSRVNEKFQ